MHMLIADDHALHRDLMRAKLESIYPEATIHEAEDYAQVESACARFRPKLLSLDLFMPGMGVLMGVQNIVRHFPDVAVLICSAVENPILVATLLAFGIKGYISKSMPAEALMEGIDEVLKGGTYVPEPFRSASTRLTRRQSEILGMICSGLSNKEIAKRLEVSVSTVKFHTGLVLEALGVQNRQQAMSLCGLA
jgi:two-component system, NarL family, nitrate/nitrite response regulator NarL